MSRPNFSNEKFIVALDRDVISVEKEKLEKLISIAKEAKEKKFSKTELLTGPRVVHWEHEQLCTTIMKVKHDPLWGLIVNGI